MKKNITITFSLIAIFIFSMTKLTAQDATANKILGTVSATYQTYKTIKAGFSISIINTQSKSKIKQNGTLYLKGKKFKITLSDQEIYCDGKTMWSYFKEENEVQITKFDPDAQDINPAEIFTIYQKGFNSKYVGETIVGGKKIQKIELSPINKAKPYFKVKLDIDKATHKVVNMSVMNKNGVNSTYSVTSFTSNLTMNDTFFKFDTKSKPGVVVIDLTKN
ncbi:MAG: outer membrane lipoprotein-sorting protein [Bacteroidia bacterium]|jgi:outer membrane lipoprotein-sorting protein